MKTTVLGRLRRPSRALPAVLCIAAVAAALTGAHGAPAQAMPASHGPAVVHTHTGPVRGRLAATDRMFLGIPYAAPPVGRLRWRPPQPVRPWRGVLDATRPGPVCPQLADDGTIIGSEDCLSLNITTPTRTGHSRLPVMVWIPGGGFVQGAGSAYDPTRLVTQGHVVVVTINYRLGALGFLAHPALRTESPDAGNYGLADQQAALGWVRRNIAAFGGDPRQLTIFGQSAGAYSVCAHLAAPGSRGLFTRAIVQSGPCGNAFVTNRTAQTRGLTAAAQLGCADPAIAAACLRAKPAAALVPLGADRVFTATTPIADLPWMPVVDTPVLPVQPLTALQSGTAARLPLLQGSTHDELRPFVALQFFPPDRQITTQTYPLIIQSIFGHDAAVVLAHYPAGHYPSPGIALATVLTDWGRKFGACPALPADNAAAHHAPVYAYEWAQDSGQQIGTFPLGAPHGGELPYLLDGSYSQQPPPTTPQQRLLAQRLIGYWTRFAKTGNPNTPGLPYWPSYQADGPVLSLTAAPNGIKPTSFATAHHCTFWNMRNPVRL